MYQTDKEVLTIDDIRDYLLNYSSKYVPVYQKLLDYYNGKNTKILSKESPDPNNPDNRTVAAYGRKIVTTYTGYGYRPRYITYKGDNPEYLQ